MILRSRKSNHRTKVIQQIMEIQKRNKHNLRKFNK